jgi:polyphosphate kinase
MAQTTASWWLSPDGTWTRHSRDDDGNPLFDVQESLIRKRRSRGTRGDDPSYSPGTDS